MPTTVISSRVSTDPLGADTEKRRTQLLFVSCFSILLATYGLEVVKIPWIEFDIPKGAPHILAGALSAALWYSFAFFCLQVWQDLNKWRLSGELATIQMLGTQNTEAHANLYKVESTTHRHALAELGEHAIRNIIAKAEQFFADYEQRKRRTVHQYTLTKVSQWIKLVVFEIGIPSLLALIAIWRISWAFWPFVMAILTAPTMEAVAAKTNPNASLTAYEAERAAPRVAVYINLPKIKGKFERIGSDDRCIDSVVYMRTGRGNELVPRGANSASMKCEFVPESEAGPMQALNKR